MCVNGATRARVDDSSNFVNRQMSVCALQKDYVSIIHAPRHATFVVALLWL